MWRPSSVRPPRPGRSLTHGRIRCCASRVRPSAQVDGELELGEAIALVCLYGAYVFVVVVGRSARKWWNRRKSESIELTARTTNGEAEVELSNERAILVPDNTSMSYTNSPVPSAPPTPRAGSAPKTPEAASGRASPSGTAPPRPGERKPPAVCAQALTAGGHCGADGVCATAEAAMGTAPSSMSLYDSEPGVAIGRAVETHNLDTLKDTAAPEVGRTEPHALHGPCDCGRAAMG